MMKTIQTKRWLAQLWAALCLLPLGAMFAWGIGNHTNLTLNWHEPWRKIEPKELCRQQSVQQIEVSDARHFDQIAQNGTPVNLWGRYRYQAETPVPGSSILVCRFGISPSAPATNATIVIPKLVGGSTVWLDGTKIADNTEVTSLLTLPVPLSQPGKIWTLAIVSRRLAAGSSFGLRGAFPVGIAHSEAELANVRHSHDFFRTEKYAGQLGYALALSVFFAAAWAFGIRSREILWMLSLETAMAANMLTSYVYAPKFGLSTSMLSIIDSCTYFAEMLAIAALTWHTMRIPGRGRLPQIIFPVLIGLNFIWGQWANAPQFDNIDVLYAPQAVVAGSILAFVVLRGIIEWLRGNVPGNLRFYNILAIGVGGSVSFLIEGIKGPSDFVLAPYVTYTCATLFACLIAIDLVNLKRLLSEEREQRLINQARRAALESSIALASTIQETLLPKIRQGNVSVFRHHLFFKPAEGMSGDWLAHLKMPDGRQILLLGDVVGKGPQAALAVSAIIAALRQAEHDNLSWLQALTHVHETLQAMFGGQGQTTVSGAAFDPQSSVVTLFNAGAPGWIQISATSGAHPIILQGSYIGSSEPPNIGSSTLDINQDDILLAFTDGVIDSSPRTFKHLMQGLSHLELIKLLNSETAIEPLTAHMRGLAKSIDVNDDQAMILFHR